MKERTSFTSYLALNEVKGWLINMADKAHSLTLTDRAAMSLTGVTDVKEFSDNKITLKTELGGLLIRGKKLNMSHLDTDTGVLSVSGEIDMIKYTSSQSGALEGLFK